MSVVCMWPVTVSFCVTCHACRGCVAVTVSALCDLSCLSWVCGLSLLASCLACHVCHVTCDAKAVYMTRHGDALRGLWLLMPYVTCWTCYVDVACDLSLLMSYMTCHVGVA